jgi:hypothetical protein
MSERQTGKLIFGGLVIACMCALLFLVPSAYLVHKGQSRWLALAAGLAAFPLLPVGWHLLAERRRKRDGAKGTLTVGDRFVMRLVAVGLVAILPLLIFARGQTWRAVKQHPTWFLHWGGGGDGGGSWTTVAGVPVSGDARLLVFVPADAEWVVWMRATDAFTKAMEKQFGKPDKTEPDEDMAAEVLVAGRRDGFVAIVRGGKGFEGEGEQAEKEKLEKELGEYLFGGKRLPLVTAHPMSDVHLVMTEGWDAAVRERAAGGGSAPAELVALLKSAPADAPLVAAAHKAQVGGVIIDKGTGHLRIADQGLVIESDLHLASSAAAAALRSYIDARLTAGRAELPESCTEPVGKLMRGIDIGGADTTVELRMKLGFEDLVGAMFCQLGAGGGGGKED